MLYFTCLDGCNARTVRSSNTPDALISATKQPVWMICSTSIGKRVWSCVEGRELKSISYRAKTGFCEPLVLLLYGTCSPILCWHRRYKVYRAAPMTLQPDFAVPAPVTGFRVDCAVHMEVTNFVEGPTSRAYSRSRTRYKPLFHSNLPKWRNYSVIVTWRTNAHSQLNLVLIMECTLMKVSWYLSKRVLKGIIEGCYVMSCLTCYEINKTSMAQELTFSRKYTLE